MATSINSEPRVKVCEECNEPNGHKDGCSLAPKCENCGGSLAAGQYEEYFGLGDGKALFCETCHVELHWKDYARDAAGEYAVNERLDEEMGL